jgi:hypothetical protein
MEVWADGVSLLSFSGDVTTDSATTVNGLEIQGIGNTVSYLSEIIVATTDTRAMALWSLTPTASGTTQQFTPNTVGNIDDLGFDDATLVATTDNTHKSGWTTPTTYPTSSTGGWILLAVAQSARVLASVGGPQTFKFYCRVGGVDAESSAITPTTSFQNYHKLWTTNCNTAAAWATGDIVAGFNLGISAAP